MAMSKNDVVALVGDVLMPLWSKERTKLNRIDRWARWDHEAPHKPAAAGTTREYKELIARAQSPWGDLIVSSIAQTLYVEGYRRPDANEDLQPWSMWQANGMDARQVALHRAALTYGLAYETVMPGKTLTGQSMPVMRGMSPREMVAVYEDVAIDEWPANAMRVTKSKDGFKLAVFDDELVHDLTLKDVSEKASYESSQEHGAGVCPVVRFANRFDLEGRSTGEIEPIIPLLGKIDQTSYDRLVVQRFAAWIVRTISGMSPEKSAEAAGTTIADILVKLRVGDFLSSPDADTKFGSLPATPLDGFISSHDADVRELASVTQSPVHEVLGTMANMSAEALAAARASQTAKSDEIKHVFGEAHEQALRLASHIAGDTASAEDFTAQVRWKDTEIRSLSQAADALGKMATMLGIPLEILWEKVPGFTDFDVKRAKELVQRDDAVINALKEAMNAATPPPVPGPTPVPAAA